MGTQAFVVTGTGEAAPSGMRAFEGHRGATKAYGHIEGFDGHPVRAFDGLRWLSYAPRRLTRASKALRQGHEGLRALEGPSTVHASLRGMEGSSRAFEGHEGLTRAFEGLRGPSRGIEGHASLRGCGVHPVVHEGLRGARRLAGHPSRRLRA